MNTRFRARIVTLAALVAIGVVAVPGAAGAAQGHGNPTLKVAPALVVDGRPVSVTVTGRDYLVPPHAPGIDVFGGVYLFFGWVRPGGGWGPSARNSSNNDGVFGVTYSYRGDGGNASTRDDGSGTMRFISFTKGGESGSSTPFHMDNNGNWTTTVKIPDSAYRYRDPSGQVRATDCLSVQCGVFTIGAHGKASVTNERFAPIEFQVPVTPTTRPPTQSGGPTPTTLAPPPVTVAPTVPDKSPTTTTATTRPRATSTTQAPSTTVGAAGSDPTTPVTSGSASAQALRNTGASGDDGSSFGWWALVAVALLAIGGTSFVGQRRRRIARG